MSKPSNVDPDVETNECSMCGKTIGDDEYVVNWGSCSVCFNQDYDDYIRSQKWTLRRSVSVLAQAWVDLLEVSRVLPLLRRLGSSLTRLLRGPTQSSP
jgi:hypothetical protein